MITTSSAAKATALLFVILSPFLFLFAVERALAFVHDHVSSDYFDNEREMLARNAVLPVKFLLDPNKFASELRSSKAKVAVFGESSAAGYASSIGFADFLEKLFPEDLIVHNFAEPGSPFAGTQSDLAKLLTPYYDFIVIYAGHNEIWAYLTNMSRAQNAVITLPFGVVDHKPGDMRHSLKLMSLRNFLANNFLGANLGFTNRIRAAISSQAYEISLNSRLVHLLKSFSKEISIIKAAIASRPTENAQRVPLFAVDPVIDEGAKREIVNNFSTSILEIIEILRPNQKLVLSTILSNDLFPPLLDVASGPEIAEATRKTKSFYESLANGKLNFSDADAEALPGTAHKAYLKSAICMGGISSLESTNKLTSQCLDLALTARANDAMSNRVHPGINDFIRSLKNKKSNVMVIDPEAAIQAAKTQEEYFKYFADFHHPSATGHMVISNLLISELTFLPRVALSQDSNCDTFSAVGPSYQKVVTPDPLISKLQLEGSIAWHDNFIKKVQVPWLYRLYKERAEYRLHNCVYGVKG